MKCLKLLAAAAFVLVSGPAAAQLYVYAGAGAADPTFNGEDFDLGLPRQSDTRDTTYHLGLGYRLHRNWAVEAAYAHLGDYRHTHTASVGNTLTEDYSVTALKFAVLGIWPASERFFAYAKLGISVSKVDWEARVVAGGVAQPTLTADHRRNSLLAGIGAQYNITDHFGVRGEYENLGEVGNRSDTGRAKVTSFNVLGVFSF
jgi:opacity protein-like surface antigen